MAFATVQSPTQTTGTGSSVVLTVSSTVVNNLVVVHIKMNTSETCSSVTDDKSNTYVLSSAVDNGALRLYQAYGVQTTGGTTAITCNFSSNAVTKRIGADEYSGNDTTNGATFDVTQTANGGNAQSMAVASFNPAAMGELIVATMAINTVANWTAGSGYTLYSGTGSISTRSQYRLSGASSETAPSTWDADSNNWCEIVSAFKAPASAASTNKMFLAL